MMCCYYPTTTIAIDDDSDFLNVITQHLGIPNCVPYSSPQKAIEVLTHNIKSPTRIKDRVLKVESSLENENLSPDEQTFFINTSRIYEEIHFRERFNDVSVIIVDYYMEELNGVEVCKALSKHPSKKILLTGGTNKEAIAIEAFNNGIIHRFINKSDKNFPKLLQQSIISLKEAYFRDLSSTLLPYLPYPTKKLLQNTYYINFMRNVQDQLSATEYYLLDNEGSVTYLNAEGIITQLFLKTDEDLTNLVNIAKDQEADQEIISALEQHQCFPYFFSEKEYLTPPSEWRNYLYKAHPFPGMKNVYYAISTEKYNA